MMCPLKLPFILDVSILSFDFPIKACIYIVRTFTSHIWRPQTVVATAWATFNVLPFNRNLEREVNQNKPTIHKLVRFFLPKKHLRYFANDVGIDPRSPPWVDHHFPVLKWQKPVGIILRQTPSHVSWYEFILGGHCWTLKMSCNFM